MNERYTSPEELTVHTSAQISRLFVYPVKSCAGLELQKVMLTETGLESDRAWMVVDGQGQFLTQRELPCMALIQPQLGHDSMVLRAPGMLALHIQPNAIEAAVRVRLWGEDIAAHDMGVLAAQWMTDFLGVPARLVRFNPAHRRVSKRKWTGAVEALNQFSDGFPLLVISQASLDYLNQRLLAIGAQAVGIERFRPNIVLGDLTQTKQPLFAHDEDRLDLLHIGTAQGVVQLKPVKPCPRCPIPNINPATALSSPEVGDMLQSYRQDARVNGAVTFGMNAIIVQGVQQLLQVGQIVCGRYQFDEGVGK